MRHLNSSVLILLLFASVNLCAQTTVVSYDYDNCGNRILRSISIIELKSGVTNDLQKQQEDSLAKDLSIKIYPNPTSGILKVEVFFAPANSKIEANLYTLNGNLVVQKTNLSPEDEIDISELKDGTYILKVKIINIVYTWKIIKNTN